MSRKRVACPSCGTADRSQNNLLLFDDSDVLGYCFLEQKTVSLDNSKYNSRQQRDSPKNDGLELAAIKALPIKELHGGLISQATAERFGVRQGVSEETGEIDRIYYPYYSEDQIVGYKIRTVPKGFVIAGRIQGLFGQHAAKKGGKMLVITEGEKDCLAVAEIFSKRGKTYNVVSLPNGANVSGELDGATRNELEFMTSHALVVLCMDMDKPGIATAQALAELLCSQCRVKVLKLPTKDAFNLLEEGKDEALWIALSNTPDYHPEKIFKGSQITLESLMEPVKPGYSIPFPKLNGKIQGIRKGEIALITGGSGLGKTQFVKELTFHLANAHNLKIANIMLETPMLDVARSHIAMDLNVPSYKLMFNPDLVSKEDYKRSYEKMVASDKMLYFHHWGSLDSKNLLSQCYYFTKVLGADFILIDHISLTVAGIDVDERKALDMAFESLTRLCVETGVGVIVVMHLKRVQGKSWAAGAEVELTDLRGSAGAEQMSWTVISVERDSQSETKRDLAKLRVLKNRTTGFLGVADTLSYSHETGRLTTLTEMEY